MFLALRLSTIRQSRSLRQLSSVHALVLAIFLFACAFSISTLFLFFGYGTFAPDTCKSADILCLVLYVSQKYTLYLFLVERSHIPASQSRREDPIYLAGLSFVLVGFTAVGICSFVYFNAHYTSICHIGLNRSVAAAFLAWDIFVSIFLTFVFLYRMRESLAEGVMMIVTPVPLRRFLERFQSSKGPISSSGIAFIPQESIVNVIRKTLWACIGILLSTVTNLTILFIYARGEDVWLCFTLCTVDGTFHRLTALPPQIPAGSEIRLTFVVVSWAVIIIFWLTMPASDPHFKQPSLNQVQTSTIPFLHSCSIHTA